MSLTEREKAIAGFAWQAGQAGSSMAHAVQLLGESEDAGFFQPEIVAAALRWQEKKKAQS